MELLTTNEVAERPAIRRHPDIFTAEEAWQYMKLPSMRSFNTHRREHGIKGKRVGHGYIFSREQLDALRMKMFGMDLPGRKAK